MQAAIYDEIASPSINRDTCTIEYFHIQQENYFVLNQVQQIRKNLDSKQTAKVQVKPTNHNNNNNNSNNNNNNSNNTGNSSGNILIDVKDIKPLSRGHYGKDLHNVHLLLYYIS